MQTTVRQHRQPPCPHRRPQSLYLIAANRPGGGMCSRRHWHKRVPHPALRDRCEPSTSPCRSRDRAPPATAGGGIIRRDVCPAAQACTASGASRSPRAKHVPVPLARRDRPPPATAGGGMCARPRLYRCHVTATRGRGWPPPPADPGPGSSCRSQSWPATTVRHLYDVSWSTSFSSLLVGVLRAGHRTIII